MASSTGSGGNRCPPLCGGRRRVVATKKRVWTNPLAVNNSVKKLQRREICSKPYRSSSITKSLHRFCNFRLTVFPLPSHLTYVVLEFSRVQLLHYYATKFFENLVTGRDIIWDTVQIRILGFPCYALSLKSLKTMGFSPPWLKPLLCENFFVQCKLHADSHKLIFGRIRWTVMRIRNIAPNMEFMVTSPSSGFPKDLWSPKGTNVKIGGLVSHVVALNSDNFNEIVMDKTNDVLVEFYATWL
ncbi:hypothetical protein L6452_08704 [Arctium lappa]|uniref:Uncharacterized protein n=1 Tax=Arctium lappa TaxID=4217 RepID=A0ACB9DIH4_ARCLA|nr:hypothetical protein L6452_08704 [Arctium lappa]